MNNAGRICGVLLQLEILVFLEQARLDLLFTLAKDVFISSSAISAAMGSLVRFRLPAVAAFFACDNFLFLVRIIEVGAIWTTSPDAECEEAASDSSLETDAEEAGTESSLELDRKEAASESSLEYLDTVSSLFLTMDHWFKSDQSA